MAKGFFSRFRRSEAGEQAGNEPNQAPSAPVLPTAELAQIVRGIARQGLPTAPRKAAISLRLDAEVLDWFKAQGPGYQSRINAVLKAYKDSAS